MNTRTSHLALVLTVSINLFASGFLSGQDGTGVRGNDFRDNGVRGNGVVSPSDIILLPQVESEPIPQTFPAPSRNFPPQIQDLPQAPQVDDSIEPLLKRMQPPTDDVVDLPIDLPVEDNSCETIRQEVVNQYDREFAAGFPDDGWVSTHSDGWTHQPFGRIVMDSVFWTDDTEIGGAPNYFEVREARLAMEGTGYGVYDYRIQLDFEPEASDTDGGTTVGNFGTVRMEDLYLSVHEVPLFGRIRLGHQKVNFGLQQMMNRRDLLFAERSPMSDPPGFTPGREIGISAMRSSARKTSTMGYGAYFDDINPESKERVDDNQGYLLASRSTFTPRYDEPSDGRYLIHFGSSGIYRRPQDGMVRFMGRPDIHEGPILIDTLPIAANQYAMLGGEFAAQAGPMMLQSEFMYANLDEVGGGKRQLWSYYVEGAYRLTGEHRTYSRETGRWRELVPFENFWMVPGSRGLGAWELAMRYSYTDFDDSPNNADLEIFSYGVNWYWNPSTRMMMNYIHPMTEGGAFGNTESDLLLLRFGVWF